MLTTYIPRLAREARINLNRFDLNKKDITSLERARHSIKQIFRELSNDKRKVRYCKRGHVKEGKNLNKVRYKDGYLRHQCVKCEKERKRVHIRKVRYQSTKVKTITR